MPKRVAVLGGGSSGLTAIKECKDEGLDVVCYERTDNWGGLWRYRDEDNEGVPSVMRSTIINTSKEMGAFSDFPPPKEYPNFMHNTELIEYFGLYAKKFDLLRHIKFNHEVLHLDKTEDYEKTGRWILKAKDKKNQKIVEEVFDGVMICVGHHVFPNVPTFPGLEKFKGTVFHTHSFKDPTIHKGRTAVVIGIGNSAVDAAVDLSYVCKKVYLSTRRGSWIMARVGKRGIPFDADFHSRSFMNISKLLPKRYVNSMIEEELEQKMDHAMYKLKPQHRFTSQHPTISDGLPCRILSGAVVVKGDVKNFTPEGVVFQGENESINVDIVVLATGYQIKFPFLCEDIVQTRNNHVMLYKYAFPPQLSHPSLILIGLIQPVGAIFPIAEMQSRWFALLQNGKLKFPSEKQMMADIKRKNDGNARRYVSSPRHTIQVDWLPFMDELAGLIGVKPNLFLTALSDPKLFWTLLTGPCGAYQYRLRGPHSWKGARAAILGCRERMLAPLDTRPAAYNSKGSSMTKMILSFVVFGVVLSIIITAVMD